MNEITIVLKDNIHGGIDLEVKNKIKFDWDEYENNTPAEKLYQIMINAASKNCDLSESKTITGDENE